MLTAHLPAPPRPTRLADGHATRPDRGVISILGVLLLVVLIALLGLSIDMGYLWFTGHQLQTAADASAMAAARWVDEEGDPSSPYYDPTGQYPLARKAAVDCGNQNEAAGTPVTLDANFQNTADGDIVLGTWDFKAKTFTPSPSTPGPGTVGLKDKAPAGATKPNAVRVRARRWGSMGDAVPLLFGDAFDVPEADASRTATAVLAPPATPLVLVLADKDPDQQAALQLNGDAVLDVSPGVVQVNSIHAQALEVLGSQVLMTAKKTRVGGGASYQQGTIVGPVLVNQSPVKDPLAGVLPDTQAWKDFKNTLPKKDSVINKGGTYSPGYYPGGIDLTNTAVAILKPGIYMLAEKGVTLKGSAFVQGTDVTLLIDKGAKVDIAGSGAGMQISATNSGQFQGIALFHHRENSGKVAKIGGGGVLDISGVVYVPGGDLEMAGTPGKEVGAIIAWTLDNNGTCGFEITGKGLPPPSGPEYVFLVE